MEYNKENTSAGLTLALWPLLWRLEFFSSKCQSTGVQPFHTDEETEAQRWGGQPTVTQGTEAEPRPINPSVKGIKNSANTLPDSTPGAQAMGQF